MSEDFDRKTNTLALTGMITGIVGMMGIALCCCSPIITPLVGIGWFGLFGLSAAVMGYMAKQQLTVQGGEERGQQMALAAMVLGGVEITIAVLGVGFFILMLTGLIALPALDSIFSSLN